MPYDFEEIRLAENLKRLRMQKQLSQPGLAEKAKVSKGYAAC